MSPHCGHGWASASHRRRRGTLRPTRHRAAKTVSLFISQALSNHTFLPILYTGLTLSFLCVRSCLFIFIFDVCCSYVAIM